MNLGGQRSGNMKNFEMKNKTWNSDSEVAKTQLEKKRTFGWVQKKARIVLRRNCLVKMSVSCWVLTQAMSHQDLFCRKLSPNTLSVHLCRSGVLCVLHVFHWWYMKVIYFGPQINKRRQVQGSANQNIKSLFQLELKISFFFKHVQITTRLCGLTYFSFTPFVCAQCGCGNILMQNPSRAKLPSTATKNQVEKLR